MEKTPDSEYMKIAEAARFLGVTQRWVYHRVLSGELPASKVGGLYFISRKDLQALLAAGRVSPEPEGEKKSEPALPRLKCGFCYHLLKSDDEIGGTCEKEGCQEFICKQCWNLNIHTCAQHSPNREQRLRNAQEQKQAGLLPVLVKANEAHLAETTFLNRIHSHLTSFSTLIHPTTGEAVNIPSWEEILETGDERTELMHLLGKVVLDSATISALPLNAWHHYTAKNKGKKTSSLEIHVQVISRMDEMARDGFDAAPLSLDVLNLWIERLIEAPAKTGNFNMVLLAATTGWDESACAAITGAQGYPFSHRLAMLYLFDMPGNALIYNALDDRSRRYAQLFSPVLGSEELHQLIQAINEKLAVYGSITLEEAAVLFPEQKEKLKEAFEAIAGEGKYKITEVKDMGIALIK